MAFLFQCNMRCLRLLNIDKLGVREILCQTKDCLILGLYFPALQNSLFTVSLTCGSSSWRPPASWPRPWPWWCQVLTEGWIMTECFHWQIVGALDSSRYPVQNINRCSVAGPMAGSCQPPLNYMDVTGDIVLQPSFVFSFIVGIVC